MSTKALLTLSASVLLSAAAFAPSAALAQLPGPPPGPPPMLAGPPPGPGFGGPPPGLAGGPPLGGRPAGLAAGLPQRGPAGVPPRDIAGGARRLDGAAELGGLDHGGQANFRKARAANYSVNSYTRNSYASYGHGYGHGYRYWPYATAAAYAYGRSYASSDDGCYYVSAYRQYGSRRVLVCHGD
jgi:hypothetical protein